MAPLTAQIEGLAQICGSESLHSDPAACGRYAVEGLLPKAVVEPESPEQIGAIVRWARAEGAALVPVGSGQLLGVGGIPARVDIAVSLRRLNSLLRYDPGDLTLTAQAGVPLAHLQEALAKHNQFLPVNPPAGGAALLGGLLATNQSGPWRYAYGSWRDIVLGMSFVTGTGKLVRTGGRVVKNVAGYDLSKLLIGSLGTLGIIVEINFKAFPQPAQRATWVAGFAELKAALALRSAIVHSPLQPLAIDLLDSVAAELLGRPVPLEPANWSLLVEAGGTTKVLDRYHTELTQRTRAAGAVFCQRLEGEAGQTLWARVCDFVLTARKASPTTTILRASLLLTQMENFLAQANCVAQRHGLAAASVARAGSGIVHLALVPESGNEMTFKRVAQAVEEIRQESARLGGQVAIEWAPTAVQRHVNTWGPAPDSFALMQGLKKEFDPDHVLNPGRFVGGI